MPSMNTQTLKFDSLLLITAAIWGFAFVAQRVGMDYVGPFSFSGVRFALSAFSLLPLLFLSREERTAMENILPSPGLKMVVSGGFLAGFILFMGISLQQVGLVYTTAGKAGFITCLYVIIVPMMALFWKQSTTLGTWLGAVFAVIGLYLLSVTEAFTIEYGDLLEFFGAFFFAAHVIVIGWLSPKIQPVKLAFCQFVTCASLSLMIAVLAEEITLNGLIQASWPLFYGGVISGGVGYTLQVIAQRHTHAAHASILMSLEGVFAAIGGWLLLGETLSLRGLIGCGLMLTGMLLSQLWGHMNKTSASVSD